MELTSKQEQILSLAARGLKDRHIADKMGLSVRTVQNHLARIVERHAVQGKKRVSKKEKC